MKIQGYEVTDDQIAACEAVIAQPTFTMQAVIDAAVNVGVGKLRSSGDRAGRLADRLVQKHRKAGAITHKAGVWYRIDGA